MPRLLKLSAIALGALLALVLAIVALIAATFNPNDYKPTVIKLVKDKTGRNLSIPGQIKLSFFPKIGADLGKISLSEVGAATEFAGVDHARVALSLLPLLAKDVVVDRVEIDGLRANLVRFADGHTNFDDLLGKKEDDKGQKVKFAIDSVKVSNASLGFDDRMAGRRAEIGHFNMSSGGIANGVPSQLALSANVKLDNPALNAAVVVKTDFTIDTDHQHFILKALDASISGAYAEYDKVELKAGGNADLKLAEAQFAFDDVKLSASAHSKTDTIEAKLAAPRLAASDKLVDGDKISGELRLTQGARSVSADLTLPSFNGTRKAFKLPTLMLDVGIKDPTLEATARLSGTFTADLEQQRFDSDDLGMKLEGKQGGRTLDGKLNTAVHADLKGQQVDVPLIAAVFNLPNPAGGSIKFEAKGSAALDLAKQLAHANLHGALDDSPFNARLALRSFAVPAYDFAFDIDTLDLSRYQAKTAPAPAPAKGAPAAAEAPIDLSALKALNANGSVKIGTLKAEGMQAKALALELHAGNGKLSAPLSAKLYGGTLAGGVTLDFAAGAATPRISVVQALNGVQLGALLKDAIKKQPVEGTGDVSLDVSTQGATLSQMRRALSGMAKLKLADGAVSGFNLAQIVRDAKAKLSLSAGSKTGTAQAADKTDFSELSGTFRISEGVAHNEDLTAKTPLFRLGGAGNIDLGREQLDYLLKCTVVATLQGQGGPEIRALKGVTVPVRLDGPLAAMNWHIDFGALATDVAKQKVQEQVKDKVKDKVGDALKGLLGR